MAGSQDAWPEYLLCWVCERIIGGYPVHGRFPSIFQFGIRSRQPQTRYETRLISKLVNVCFWPEADNCEAWD